MVSWWCFFWTVTNEGPPPRNDRMLTCHCQKNVFALRSGFTDNLNDNIQCIKRHLCKLAYIYTYICMSQLFWGGRGDLTPLLGKTSTLVKVHTSKLRPIPGRCVAAELAANSAHRAGRVRGHASGFGGVGGWWLGHRTKGAFDTFKRLP